MEDLTNSLQNYLKAVYALSPSGEGAQVSDIAHMVGVQKSSASVAVKTLQQRELVRRDTDHKVYLTSEGESQAVLVFDKYTILRQFLAEILNVDIETADSDASAMKHLVSMESICAMCKLTNSTTGNCMCSKDCRPQDRTGIFSSVDKRSGE